MNQRTIAALNAINRRFYDERADEFDRTRERAWRGWTELFDRYRHLLPSSPRVLDVGCGNGRFARFLHDRGESFTYVGVDASAIGLRYARARLEDVNHVRLFQHDFVIEQEPLPGSIGSEEYDLIVLFGVLHHVPGRERRIELVTRLVEHLTRAGVFVYTVWHFRRFERFTRKLVPWDEFLESETAPRVDVDDLEPGDYIMTWGDGTAAHRYCHAMSDDEAEALSRALPLTSIARFDGDGDVNTYWVSVKKAPLDGGETAQRERRARLE